ncbi:MAG: hypothetical protein Q9227_007822 [Pyrenula ochraceoflavens]
MAGLARLAYYQMMAEHERVGGAADELPATLAILRDGYYLIFASSVKGRPRNWIEINGHQTVQEALYNCQAAFGGHHRRMAGCAEPFAVNWWMEIADSSNSIYLAGDPYILTVGLVGNNVVEWTACPGLNDPDWGCQEFLAVMGVRGCPVIRNRAMYRRGDDVCPLPIPAPLSGQTNFWAVNMRCQKKSKAKERRELKPLHASSAFTEPSSIPTITAGDASAEYTGTITVCLGQYDGTSTLPGVDDAQITSSGAKWLEDNESWFGAPGAAYTEYGATITDDDDGCQATGIPKRKRFAPRHYKP